MSDRGAEDIAGISLLADLGESEQKAFAQQCRWRYYGAGEQIIDRQDETTDIYFVVSGLGRIVNYSLSGREVTFDDLTAGSHFGELSALDGQPRSASVMSLESSLIAALPQDRFNKLLQSNPEISFRVLRALAGIIRNSTDRIMDLSTLAANNRVQADLMRQARHGWIGATKAESRPIPGHGDITSRV